MSKKNKRGGSNVHMTDVKMAKEAQAKAKHKRELKEAREAKVEPVVKKKVLQKVVRSKGFKLKQIGRTMTPGQKKKMSRMVEARSGMDTD